MKQLSGLVDSLIERASMQQSYLLVSSRWRSSTSPEAMKYYASEVGKTVLSLSADERALLSTLKASDLSTVRFVGYGAHMRPAHPVRQRVRGPLCLAPASSGAEGGE